VIQIVEELHENTTTYVNSLISDCIIKGGLVVSKGRAKKSRTIEIVVRCIVFRTSTVRLVSVERKKLINNI
jgi:hypothetical protein